MVIRKLKINSQTLVYFVFFFLSFFKGFGLLGNDPVYLCAYVIATGLVFINILKGGFTKRELLINFTLLSLGTLVLVFSGETTLLFSAILIFSLKGASNRTIIKAMLVARIFAFLSNILLSSIGVIPFNSMIFYRSTAQGFITRYSFGFLHPNTFHSSFTLIVILFGYLKARNIKIAELIIFLIGNCIIFRLSQSRTNFIICSVYLILCFLVSKSYISTLRLKQLTIMTIALCIISSFALANAYGHSELVSRLDTMLTGRIRYMSAVVKNYNIPLINNNHYTDIAFDNGYFDLFYNGGLLAGIAYSCLLIQAIKQKAKTDDKNSILLILICLLFSMTESFFCNVLMNPSLIFLKDAIRSEKDKQYIGKR